MTAQRLLLLEDQFADTYRLLQQIRDDIGRNEAAQPSRTDPASLGATATRSSPEPRQAEMEALQRRLATAEKELQQTSAALEQLQSASLLQYVNKIPGIETQTAEQGSALAELTKQVAAIQAHLAAQATVVEGLQAQDQQLSVQLTTVQNLVTGMEEHGGLKTSAVAEVPGGLCDGLKNSDTRAWQTALDRIGGGLKILSVDFPGHVAYVRTTKGNREAIRTIDVLERAGCL